MTSIGSEDEFRIVIKAQAEVCIFSNTSGSGSISQ